MILDGIFGYTVLPLFGQLKLSYRQIRGKHTIGERKTILMVILKNMIVILEDSFWNDIKSFMVITKGLILVSRTREQIAQNLCKEGPLILRSLLETDLLHLVDLLTLDKKRVEETPLKLHFQSHSACWEEI